MARNSRDDDRGRDRDRDDSRSERSRDRRGGGRDRDDDRDDRGRGRKDGGRFEYAGRSKEDNAKRANQSSARYDRLFNEDVPYFSSKSGENQIRIVPWLNKKFENFDELVEKYGNHWGVDGVIHRNVGADNGTYFCLDKMCDQPCPICDVWREEDNEKLKPSDRMFCWVIDRNDEKSGPKLWNMPLGNSKDIAKASEDRKTGELRLVEHPDEGYDIFFDREGEKDRTRYKQFATDREQTPLHDNPDKADKWLDFVTETPLPELFKYYDAEYLQKVLAGQKTGDDDDDRGRDRDRDDRRRGRDDDDGGRSERSSRRRPREDEDDAGEQEFTRPARRQARRDPEEEDPGEDDGSERDSRGSGGRREARGDGGRGRSSRREDPPEDDSPEPEEEEPETPRGGRAGPRGGSTERYRPKDREEPDDSNTDDGGGEDDVASAKENLRRVGRRGRK